MIGLLSKSLPGAVGLLMVSAVILLANSGRAQHSANPRSNHWAFNPPVLPRIPQVSNRRWIRSPIDSFILARLEAKGIPPPRTADRRTLLRRLYLDLIGVPPTPEEQHAFLTDRAPYAYERLVDNLLARPQYGERWSRHWLDAARYAETNGYERDGSKPS